MRQSQSTRRSRKQNPDMDLNTGMDSDMRTSTAMHRHNMCPFKLLLLMKA